MTQYLQYKSIAKISGLLAPNLEYDFVDRAQDDIDVLIQR
jgi:hypothetical protein